MSTNMVISSKQKALRPETYNETRFGVKKQFTVSTVSKISNRNIINNCEST